MQIFCQFLLPPPLFNKEIFQYYKFGKETKLKRDEIQLSWKIYTPEIDTMLVVTKTTTSNDNSVKSFEN